MTAANTTILNVDEKAHSYAKIYAALLKDELQRKRAYASIVALYSLINELEKTDNDVQKAMTLFRNPVLNEQYEIADVYVNNWHIDVRIVTEGNAFLVPKSHLDNDIVPDFYAVIRVDNQLKTAELLGFADTAVLEKEPFDYHYYAVSFDSLIPYEKFLSKVDRVKLTDFSEQEHEFFRANYLSLMDDELDIQTKNKLLKHLFECSQCRTEFCCFTGFEMVSCNMGKYPNLFQDQTLDIIAAQAVDSEKYAGKEETIYFTDEPEDVIKDDSQEKEEPSQEQEAKDENPVLDEDLKEETVSDILDELFNIDEDIIEPEPAKEKEVVVTPQPTVSESGDLEIIEQNEVLEIIEESSDISFEENSSNDLEVISDDSMDMISDDSDEVVLIESEPIEFKDEDLEIKPSEEVEIIEETADETITEENVQKVIVDYDEYGEPIYSYITNVPQDEVAHIEPIDEDIDILNEEFETYPVEEQEDVLSEINNGAARPIEYVESDDEVVDIEIKEQNDEEPIIEIKEDENELVDISLDEKESEDEGELAEENSEENFIEYKEDDVEEDEKPSDDEYIEFDEDELKPSADEEFEEYKEDDAASTIDINDDILADDETSEDEVNDNSIEEFEDEADGDEEYEEYSDGDSDEEDEESGEYEEYSDEEYDEDDETVGIPEDNVTKSSSKKGLLIASALLIFALVGCGIGAFLFFKNSNQNSVSTQTPVPTENNVEASVDPQINDMFEASEEGGLEIPAPETPVQTEDVPTVEGELLPPPPPIEQAAEQSEPQQVQAQEVQNSNPADVSKSIANAFSPTANPVTLRAVNWLCSPQLFADSAFKAYMQGLDDILKLNLRKNILDVSETPTNNTVTVKMAVDNNRNLIKVAVADSSGSAQVDNIVLQSINETFEGEKSPILNDSPQKADVYYLKVVIKL